MSKCKGINRKGKGCGSDRMPGSEYCEAHQDQAPKRGRTDNHNTIQEEKAQVPTKVGRVSRVIKLACSLIGLLSVLLNFWLGYYFILPRVTASIEMPSNSNFPFESHISIANNGNFAITNVVCSLEDSKLSASVSTPLTMYTHDREGKLAGKRVVRFPEIKAGHSEPLELAKMLGLVGSRADSASFSLKISYKPAFLSIKTQVFRFKLFKTVDGNYNWLESTI